MKPLLWGFSALSAVVHALVVMQLWKWFLVPLGVMPITLVHAYGLDVLARMLTGGAHRELLFAASYDTPDQLTEEQQYERIKREFARTFVNLGMWVIYLALGYVAHRLRY